eukprot:NODE_26_length_40862_cov_0.679513.p19 type:complete len:270 gc:universal NODE_26_length_40862_cov_0.679513:18279-17470(-)
MIIISFIMACDKLSEVPQCHLPADCTLTLISKTSYLVDLNHNAQNVCTPECSSQYRNNIAKCLYEQNKPEILKYCIYQWNSRCTKSNGILCYKERLDTWIAQGAATVDDVSSKLSTLNLTCSTCQSRMISNELKFESVSNDTFAERIKAKALASCGKDFLGSWDDTDFLNDETAQDSMSGTNEDLWWIILVSIIGALIIAFSFGALVWKKKQKLKRQDSQLENDDYYNPRRSILNLEEIRQPIINNGAPAPNHQTTHYESSYMVSKPFK